MQSLESQPSPTTQQQQQQQQQQQSSAMSVSGQTPSSHGGGGSTKAPRRKSAVMTASRKVVTTVGRPLRAVGRAVSGNRRRAESHEDAESVRDSYGRRHATASSGASLAPAVVPNPVAASSSSAAAVLVPAAASLAAGTVRNAAGDAVDSDDTDRPLQTLFSAELNRSLPSIPGSHGTLEGSIDTAAAAAATDPHNQAFARTASASPDESEDHKNRNAANPNHASLVEPQKDASVHYVEQTLRQIVLLCLAYFFGTARPDYTNIVAKTFEYTSIAWATCVVILLTSWIQHRNAFHRERRLSERERQQQLQLQQRLLFQQQHQQLRQAQSLVDPRLSVQSNPNPQPSTFPNTDNIHSNLDNDDNDLNNNGDDYILEPINGTSRSVNTQLPSASDNHHPLALPQINSIGSASIVPAASTATLTVGPPVHIHADVYGNTPDSSNSSSNNNNNSSSSNNNNRNAVDHRVSLLTETPDDSTSTPTPVSANGNARERSLLASPTNAATSAAASNSSDSSNSRNNSTANGSSDRPLADTTNRTLENTSHSIATAEPSSPSGVPVDAPPTTTPILTDEDMLPHPALAPFYIMDHATKERIFPNIDKPVHISTELFEMDMLVIIRTPDVDNPKAPSGTPSNNRMVNYLRGRQRRFEFQYQIRVKKVPPNKAFYFSCELDQPVKMGLIQRAFVGASMAFMKSTNPTFHYSTMGSKPTPDGKYEKPHMSFTVEGSLDRLVVTKPGETPPKLGSEIYEPPEHMKKRKKGGFVKWNTTDIYTMALWSAYVDFLDWKVINLPGIRPFLLSSVLGEQAMSVSFYMIDEDKANEKHYRKDISEVVNLELCNVRQGSPGPLTKVWMAKQKTLKKKKEKQLSQQQERQKQSKSVVNCAVAAADTLPEQSNEGSPVMANNGVAPSSDVSSAKTAPTTLVIENVPKLPDLPKKDPSMLDEDITDDEVPCVPPKVTISASTSESGAGFGGKLSSDQIDEDNDDEDAATAAELGQGLYLQSGDRITLKQFVETNDDSDSASDFTMSNGAGFAVLQNQADCTVTIEKARKGRRNKLIKTGDAVLFKVQQKRRDEYETRYLTIHRGWWLKWVTRLPKKNGYFTICGVDKDTENSYVSLGSAFKLRHKRWSNYYVGVATEASPTYGGRLLALYNPSASSKTSSNAATSDADEEYDTDDGDAGDFDGPIVNRDNKHWMQTLVLYADDVAGGTTLSPRDSSPVANSFERRQSLTFSKEHARIDVPAWIEMMNRTERIRQLAYAVRIVHRQDQAQMDDEQQFPRTSVRLRTGRELAPLMRFGLTHRNISSPQTPGDDRVGRRLSTSFHHGTASKPLPLSKRASSIDGLNLPLSPEREVSLSLSPRQPVARTGEGLLLRSNTGDVSFGDEYIEYDEGAEADSIVSAEEFCTDIQSSVVHEEWMDAISPDDGADSEIEQELEQELDPEPEPDLDDLELEPETDNSKHSNGRMKRGKALIGKVAKKAKNVTVATGKTAGKVVVGTGKLTGKAVVGTAKLTGKSVVSTGKLTGKVAVGTGKVAMRHSKKVVRGSMSTGKAVIGPITRKGKNVRRQEPRASKNVFKESKRQDQDKQVEVFKGMKKIGRDQLKMTSEISAGELCAPEQSCRIASSVLSRMSDLDPSAPMWSRFNTVLKKQLSIDTEQDRWFLHGNHVHIGVTPVTSRGEKLHDSLVARCLWESHWREEWCGVYKSCVSFYAPLSKSPSLEISYIDITNVRPLDAAESSPLPGFPLLVLETAWVCHYMAFRDEESRDTFGERIETAIVDHVKEVEISADLDEKDLRKARFWQGFQNLSESAISPGRGKWAKVVSNQKSKERAILNSRRMVFDLDSTTTSFGDASNGFEFVEKMLATALSFSLKSLENDPESFVRFLDATSHLRLLPLHQMEFASNAAFCLFVNLYHTLLQHAMLLSINGPLHKRSVGHFMRTSCYEVGGDVFSLAELHCCVLRGRQNRPFLSKPPYIEPPKKSVSSYKMYALACKDPRLAFCVNTADVACPRDVPIVQEDRMNEQLNGCTVVFLKHQMVVDVSRKVIILPKVCEVYRHDFGGGDPMSCLRVCLAELRDDPLAKSVRTIIDDDSLQIRFRHTIEQYHTSLELRRMASEDSIETESDSQR